MPTVVVDRPAPVATSGAAISWPAIFAGAAAACATTLSLLVLSAALGLSMVSPWYYENASATSFAVSGAIALVVMQWVSSGLGGYIAGRLRPDWPDHHDDETFFRDTAHGFLAWCVATILVFACAMSMAAATARTTATVAAQAAAPAIQAGAQSLASQNDYYADLILRPAPGAPAAATGNADPRSEVARIMTRALSGELSQSDTQYLAQVVAARAGLPPEQAAQRVTEVANLAQTAKARAQETAEQARKTASRTALFTFLSLIVGAFIGAAAGAYGGSLRADQSGRVNYFRSTSD